MWFFLFLPILAFAQTEIDLSAIENLEDILPDHDIKRDAYRDIEFERKNREFRHPIQAVTIEEIKESGLSNAFLKAGTTLYRLEDNTPVRLTKDIYLKVFKLEDEHNFRYLRAEDGSMKYRVSSQYVTSIDHELALYEPPTRYTPAPANIIRTEYDRKLRLVPELAVYGGVVQSRFIRDLFNDPKARTGNTNQYGLHYFTNWNLPVKVGAAVHYERSSYNLEGNGLVFYQALSVGPQFRTQDFDLFETNWRLTTQIRVSPFAKLRGETVRGNVDFKFNSTDLMTTAEHPWENRFGQFVIGAFHQAQWLNFKDQPEVVSVRASNQTNQSFGLFLSQVFQ